MSAESTVSGPREIAEQLRDRYRKASGFGHGGAVLGRGQLDEAADIIEALIDYGEMAAVFISTVVPNNSYEADHQAGLGTWAARLGLLKDGDDE